MFRPQFAYPQPSLPCHDQKTVYSFDKTNLPTLTGTLGAGVQTGRIPLRLDKDADFYLRGVSLSGPSIEAGPISVRFEDTNGNPLSDSENANQTTNFELPVEYGDPNGAGIVALDSGRDGLFGPAGGNFIVYLYNGTNGTLNLTGVVLNLHGIKRYDKEVCN
jgi:hypothetical protein